MKAKVQSAPRLSIGMIVKNEEKNLRGCLESLRPLMKKVDCELIIADTGSTDATVEIAKEFTDNVYHFEWCDDFSAARNSGLDRATGEWFVYFDADHILDENISGLVTFLNGDERQGFNMAGVTIRDYTDKRKKHYDDHLGLQLIRRSSGSRFIEPIHETFVPVAPIMIVDVILHHTGYIFEDKELFQKKARERNMPMILKELETRPDDLRMLMQALDASIDEEKPKFLKRARVVAKKEGLNNPFSKRLYQAWAIFYMRSDRDKSREAIEEYLDSRVESSPVDIPLYFVLADIENMQGNHKEALAACEHYLAAHEDFESGKMQKNDLFVMELRANNQRDVDTINLIMAASYEKLGEKERAIECAKRVNPNGPYPDIFDQLVSRLLNLWAASKNYDGLAELYRAAWEMEEEFGKKRFAELFSVWYLGSAPDERKSIECELKSAAGVGELGELMSLRTENDQQYYTEKLGDFLSRAADWELFAGIYYRAAIEVGCALPEAAYALQNERMTTAIIAAVSAKDEGAVKRAMDYCAGDFTSSIRSVLWQATVLERAVSVWGNLEADDKLQLAHAFGDAMWMYISNVYNPELLNDEDITVLPAQYRFGYFLNSARVCEQSGDETGFFRELRNALKHYKPMMGLVELLIKRHKAPTAQANPMQGELAEIARGFKDAIGKLIAEGKTADARDALRKYTGMFPSDTEAAELLAGLE